MRRTALALLALLLMSRVTSRAAAAQSIWASSVSAGTAFMVDTDDPDPPGGFSAALSVRRQGQSAFSLGVEAGYHDYLRISQDLPIGPSQPFRSILEDERAAWRIGPMLRWQASGRTIRPYGSVGANLYLFRTTYLQQERDRSGALVLDQRLRFTDLRPGLSLGTGVEIFPGRGRVGLGLGLRAHNAFGSRANGFLTVDVGIVFREGRAR
jgi:hypothetical protein